MSSNRLLAYNAHRLQNGRHHARGPGTGKSKYGQFLHHHKTVLKLKKNTEQTRDVDKIVITITALEKIFFSSITYARSSQSGSAPFPARKRAQCGIRKKGREIGYTSYFVNTPTGYERKKNVVGEVEQVRLERFAQHVQLEE